MLASILPKPTKYIFHSTNFGSYQRPRSIVELVFWRVPGFAFIITRFSLFLQYICLPRQYVIKIQTDDVDLLGFIITLRSTMIGKVGMFGDDTFRGPPNVVPGEDQSRQFHRMKRRMNSPLLRNDHIPPGYHVCGFGRVQLLTGHAGPQFWGVVV